MMSFFQAGLLGVLQGVSELFPVSSLGHSVLISSLLGWNLDQHNESFLLFLVATHFATAVVLFFFFWHDWIKIIKGLLRSLKEREIKSTDHDAQLGWKLIVATIPAGVLGLLFEESLKSIFAVAKVVSIALILNGIMLLLGEKLRQRDAGKAVEKQRFISQLNWLQTLKIGASQCIALIPGFSRTGATITGGLLVGLSHDDAARFSFLLATPIIGAAALLKFPELFSSADPALIPPLLFGAACAALSAYLTVRFLTRYFHTQKLTPFAIYCLIAGSVSTLIFFLR